MAGEKHYFISRLVIHERAKIFCIGKKIIAYPVIVVHWINLNSHPLPIVALVTAQCCPWQQSERVGTVLHSSDGQSIIRMDMFTVELVMKDQTLLYFRVFPHQGRDQVRVLICSRIVPLEYCVVT